ncbi:nucleoside recognition protein [Paenibacillus sediminis]|uniref:Sporulation integral membrane protein YlbJ n=1 Tax=Paenibacillus sediminis TaxID=664909 RepID=A0ABS4H1S3_9BACL|nr:nucleoside recognition protein [Paenibacillus sediminis]MBP1936470.1 sporulation integral membrane protein YlbJ [Paenibacillus sediminis]
MNPSLSERSHPLLTIVLSSCAVFIVVGIIKAPDEAFQASLQGLTIWWKIVFPALLPFLVLSEMMIAFGFAHGLGVCLEPLMRRLFGLPGISGWVISLGMTAGYPAGAEASVQLYRQGKLSPHEAEKLSSIAHLSNPMLLIVVIGTGFLHHPEMGILIAIVHWLSSAAAAITISWLIRNNDTSSTPLTQNEQKQHSSSSLSFMRKIFKAIHEAYLQDGRTFGKLLGDAVSRSVQTLMMTGGFMMIFAVIIKLLEQHLKVHFDGVFLKGFMEVHLGSYAVSTETFVSPVFQIALLSAFLGWSGLSAHLQVRAIMKPAGLKHTSFVITRLLHAMYAYIITLLLWKPLSSFMTLTLPAISDATSNKSVTLFTFLPHWYQFPILLGWQASVLFILVMLSACVGIYHRINSR